MAHHTGQHMELITVHTQVRQEHQQVQLVAHTVHQVIHHPMDHKIPVGQVDSNLVIKQQLVTNTLVIQVNRKVYMVNYLHKNLLFNLKNFSDGQSGQSNYYGAAGAPASGASGTYGGASGGSYGTSSYYTAQHGAATQQSAGPNQYGQYGNSSGQYGSQPNQPVGGYGGMPPAGGGPYGSGGSGHFGGGPGANHGGPPGNFHDGMGPGMRGGPPGPPGPFRYEICY